jgi:diaminohydroxyphosphoribosylaminopyrimidine deaminase/5-amino-6-(5-phosphoribosylamino)uracil reductase
LALSAAEVPVWVIAGIDAPHAAEQALRAQRVEVFRVVGQGGRLDLMAALKLIAARGITRLMVEGGPTLAAALIATDLVDEAHLFHSPATIGAEGVDALEGVPLTVLTKSERLQCVMRMPVGADRLDVFERK